MKGWVYVITNPAMPGLVKIGFSRKDPDLRAEELDNTGTPHKYRVEYDVLVENPERYERIIHCEFEKNREGKEWFRSTPEEAVAIIKRVVKKEEMLIESFKNIDEKKVPNVQQQRQFSEEEKKYITSNLEIEKLGVAANNGNIESARRLGNLFSDKTAYNESGSLHNIEKAIKYYKIAAEKGDVHSMRELGIIYTDKNDAKESNKWLWLAVNNGDTFAKLYLGNILLYVSDKLGDGRMFDVALDLLQQAAASGLRTASYKLGILYMEVKWPPLSRHIFSLQV